MAEVLLELFQLPSLENRRLHIRLCTMDKIICDLCILVILVPKPPNILRHSYPLTFMQPYARTNTFLHSFVPNTVHTWNNLPRSYVIQFINHI